MGLSRCGGSDSVGVHACLSGAVVGDVPFPFSWENGTSSNSTSESESFSCADIVYWLVWTVFDLTLTKIRSRKDNGGVIFEM